MKHISYIVGFFLLLISVQSCSNKRRQQIFEIGQTIVIPYNPDKVVPLDSIIANITIVPLETNDNCLIGQLMLQVKIHQDLIYINNMISSMAQQLLVFDLNGNFIREIGSRGQGPGEFINLFDFIFTDEGTVELLDFKKIESYTLDGKHLGTKRFDFMGTDFYLNPRNFCRSFSSGYYFWGGVVRHDEKLREKSSLMYRVNSDFQIVDGYFSPKYGDGGAMDRFRFYQDKTLITPSACDYNVYQIDPEDSVKVRYSFDFGKYGFDNSQDVDIQIIAENYIWDINKYQETDRFIYFGFFHQKTARSLLYSKVTEQTYLQSFMPSFNRNDFRLYPVHATNNNQLIAIVDIYAIKFDLERMSQENIKKWGFEELEKLDDEDNPVIIFYKTKL